MDKKDMNPRLSILDKAVIVLTYLKEYISIDYVNKIIETVKVIDNFGNLKTVIELDKLLHIFEYSKEFYTDNEIFPSPEYLELQFTCFKRSELQYSEDILNDLLKELLQLRAQYEVSEAFSRKDFKKAGDVISSLLYKKEEIKPEFTIDEVISSYDKHINSPVGIQTGIGKLDYIISGFQYKSLNVIAAPPGHFKTTTAISISYNALKCNFNVVYLTFEVPSEKIYHGFISRHSYEIGVEISAQDLKMTSLNENQRNALPEVINDFKENIGGKLSVVSLENLPDLTVSNLDKFFEKKAEELGTIDLLVIDHINLLKFSRINGIKDEKEVQNFYIRYFTNKSVTFQDQGFVLLMLAQVNRDSIKAFARRRRLSKGNLNSISTNPGASLAAFAEANELERSATTGIILYADELLKSSNSLELYLVKSRDTLSQDDPLSIPIVPEYCKIGTELDTSEFDPNQLDWDEFNTEIGFA